MSFYSVEYNVSPAVDILRSIREKVAAIRTPVFEEVRGPIRDYVLSDVQRFVAAYPGDSKFTYKMFATDRSMRWYFWAKRTGRMADQSWDEIGGSWERTGTLETSWNVGVNVTANEAFMTIENDAQDYKGDNYAQAVYGPDAVEGHIETGWGAEIDESIEAITNNVEDMLLDALDRALEGFTNG